MHILIIDDSAEDRLTYKRLLSGQENISYKFIEADNAEDGLAFYRAESPDCVLLDYSLPDMSGLEVLSELKKEQGDAILPIVMLTGVGDEQVAVNAMKLGCQDYLPKGSITAPSLKRSISNAVTKVSLHRRIIQQQKELKHLARIDDLTGLLNRRSILAELGNEYKRAQRYNQNMTVLMIDIDYFKQVNDSHGHFLGDVVLREVGRIILETIRECDLGGRYGGEEFLIVLPETSPKGGLETAERIRKRVKWQTHISKDGKILKVTCSIGVASLGEERLNIEDLVDWADRAMYCAKHSGRDQAVVCDRNVLVDISGKRLEQLV